MVKRLFDILVATAGLLLLGPVFGIAATGIRLSSHGPVLYRARRSGRDGETFTMHKVRTMHVHQGQEASAITGPKDLRVFFFGSLLRRLKIDELPQLYDVLRGRMSLVGPRPEDPRIVRDYYTPEQRETLRVLPGLASPGSIYNYTHGDQVLAQGNPEQIYVEKFLPLKLALDGVYVREANFFYDLRIILRACTVIVLMALARRKFPDPPEMAKLRQRGVQVNLPQAAGREPLRMRAPDAGAHE
jgi:lipopolysaccharide/colanic/teichoic acid biosynthesis glycosyltransferase